MLNKNERYRPLLTLLYFSCYLKDYQLKDNKLTRFYIYKQML